MVDMLSTGMSWLSARRQASLVTNYTYTRSSTSTTIPMQIATAAVEQIGGGDGITITPEDPDFIFRERLYQKLQKKQTMNVIDNNDSIDKTVRSFWGTIKFDEEITLRSLFKRNI